MDYQGKLTPAMQQYMDIKNEHQDCIIFFRLGDFYEVFFDDAEHCSTLLDLVLTSKNKNSSHPIPMAGMPHHSVDKYIDKLIQHGHKIAIVEQTSTPVPGQLVQREVVRIITPGTYIDREDQTQAIVLGLSKDKQGYHMAWGDITQGEYRTSSYTSTQETIARIHSIRPQEIVLQGGLTQKEGEKSIVSQLQSQDIHYSKHALPHQPQKYLQHLRGKHQFDSYGLALQGGKTHAFALLASYIHHTQKKPLELVQHIRVYEQKEHMLLDDITLKNLEIFHASYEHEERYSLYGVINTTQTKAGGRLLRRWLQRPLRDMQALTQRQQVLHFFSTYEHTQHIHEKAKQRCDMHSILARITYRQPLLYHFLQLRKTRHTLCTDPHIQKAMQKLGWNNSQQQAIRELLTLIQERLVSDEQAKQSDFIIRPGYRQDIDEQRQIAYNTEQLLVDYQEHIQAQVGCAVRIKYLNNKGYLLQVAQKDIPAFEKHTNMEEEKRDFVRRQTLKNTQRYSTTYLLSIQERKEKAQELLTKRESQEIQELAHLIQQAQKTIHTCADVLAHLDLYTSHYLFAQQNDYCLPQIHRGRHVSIKQGRHPVIQAFLPRQEPFIPNDLDIGTDSSHTSQDDGNIHIITGPNMGGKSTFLRQNAIIVLMAHCGLYVPAKQARIACMDGIFARVGSGDIIAKNQSTFMTEMKEVAHILHHASERSFVIFDELGRGTSTYDGLALTRSILEHIRKDIQCLTLLATHYHELIHLQECYEDIRNFSVSVYETSQELVFLKKIIKGGANKSYGIDVAQLAGLPASIVQQARQQLQAYEQPSTQTSTPPAQVPLFTVQSQSAPQALTQQTLNTLQQAIEQKLAKHDTEQITPLQALQILHERQQRRNENHTE